MTDCEGKDIQVGDEVITGNRQSGGGIYLVRGKIIRFTKVSILVAYNNGYGINDIWCKSREVFKL